MMDTVIGWRILVLAPDAFGTGGIERATRMLLTALGKRIGSDRVGLISVWGGDRTDLSAQVLHQGPQRGRRTRVPFTERGAFSLAALEWAWAWRRQLIVVSCHPHLAPVAMGAGWLAHAPVAVWCHGEEVWRPPRPSVGWALRRANLIFAPSRFTADQVVHWAGLEHEVAVIPHGISPELVSVGPAAIAGRVLTVSRLEPHDRYKEVDTLIRAWPRVVEGQPEAELIVVGEGADRARLQRLAAEEGADDRVRFTGWISDHHLRELYRTAAVFALPTSATVGSQAGGEGFGLVFLEAAAAGLPVVAGRSGAVPEVVEDGVTGTLVEPGDLVGIADAIGALLRDDALRSRMGRAARSLAMSRYSFEAFGDRIETAFGDLVSRSASEA